MSEDKWAKARKMEEQEMPKLEGKVSNRVYLLISRYYIWGWITKPLEQITDDEFLSQKFIGPRTLEEVRKVIPALAH